MGVGTGPQVRNTPLKSFLNHRGLPGAKPWTSGASRSLYKRSSQFFYKRHRTDCIFCALLCPLRSWDVACKNIPLTLPTETALYQQFPQPFSFQLPPKTDIKIFAGCLMKTSKHLFVFPLSSADKHYRTTLSQNSSELP